MPQFLLAICYDPTVPSDGGPSRQPEHARLGEEMRANGHYLGGAGLAPVDMYVKRVHRLDGSATVASGPFPRTTESLGGWFLVDCSEEEALAYASRISVDNRSWIEVRRIFVHQA